MRLTTLLFGSLAGFALAAKLPDCAGSCISQAVKSTGCSSRDSNCICTSDVFEDSVRKCTEANCGTSKAQGASSFVTDFCGNVKDLKKRHAKRHVTAREAGRGQGEHGGWGQGKDGGNWGHGGGEWNKPSAPKYGKPSAPTYEPSHTVIDAPTASPTIYEPGHYPGGNGGGWGHNGGWGGHGGREGGWGQGRGWGGRGGH